LSEGVFLFHFGGIAVGHFPSGTAGTSVHFFPNNSNANTSVQTKCCYPSIVDPGSCLLFMWCCRSAASLWGKCSCKNHIWIWTCVERLCKAVTLSMAMEALGATILNSFASSNVWEKNGNVTAKVVPREFRTLCLSISFATISTVFHAM